MSRPPFWKSALRTMRPRQWAKNLAVLAPLFFAKSVKSPQLLLQALLAFVAFSWVASSIYVLNDFVDKKKDALHPEKKHRPMAAGHLSNLQVFLLGAFCFLFGAWAAWHTGVWEFWSILASYVVLQVAYTFLLKHWVIVDVMAIALGFVLRVLGGAVVIAVPVSNWLFLCTLLLAVFLGFAKRRHELSVLATDAKSHRANLEDYSLPLLDQMMSVVAGACIVAYGLYSVAPDTVAHVGNDRMKYSVPFVVYGIFRYLFLVHRKGLGGSPEKVLLSDPGTVLNVVLFVMVAFWALYT